MPKTVHIVVQNRAICGRPGPPTEWPEDEWSCGFNVKALLADEQLCAKCATRREEMRRRK